ncbi:MAG: hypothetical protein ACE1ZS_04525 [Candidatus Poribacteria bacterium]|nr:hypothetical protein [Candidatus Poribacteria bacterium]
MFNRVWKQRSQVLIVVVLLAVLASPMVLATKGIKWEKSIEKGMAEAKKTGKPIFMDFYTDW